jgi:HEAT repeats
MAEYAHRSHATGLTFCHVERVSAGRRLRFDLQTGQQMAAGSYKSDESFMGKLAIGAAGTRQAFEDLRRQAHRPIELERGSMSFKIWRKEIKRKRIRMPDILCLNCGHRFESRGKTDLKIAMSHSPTDAARAWDVGLDDDDFVALVTVKTGNAPTEAEADTLVQYASVRDLRGAFARGSVATSARKGAEEGSEIWITWPAAIASNSGRVEELTGRSMKIRYDDGKRQRVVLSRKAGALRPLVRTGDTFRANQVLASVVGVVSSCPCPGGATLESYVAKASSHSLTDRYMAAKALRHFPSAAAVNTLVELVADEKEDIYVRVEAAAALMLQNRPEGRAFLAALLTDAHASFRLEAVIVLGEVPTPDAADLLRQTLARANEHPDVRAAAAWSLGETGLRENIDALVASFSSLEQEIRTEAARALAKLARRFRDSVLATFPSGDEDKRPGIAWALSRAGVSVPELLPALVDDDARRWIAYMIGFQSPTAMLADIDSLRERDAEVFFAVTVLWKILGSWIRDLDEY